MKCLFCHPKIIAFRKSSRLIYIFEKPVWLEAKWMVNSLSLVAVSNHLNFEMFFFVCLFVASTKKMRLHKKKRKKKTQHLAAEGSVSVGVRLRKTNSIEATSESLCCPAKCIVSFKRGLLIKNQQRRITAGSGAVTQRLLKPPPPHPSHSHIHLKATRRQRRLFRMGPLSPPTPPAPPPAPRPLLDRSVAECV